jgi:hypothetical protein
VGDAIVVWHAVQDKLGDAAQLYKDGSPVPEAVKFALCPKQIVALLELIVGCGLTVIDDVTVARHVPAPIE